MRARILLRQGRGGERRRGYGSHDPLIRAYRDPAWHNDHQGRNRADALEGRLAHFDKTPLPLVDATTNALARCRANPARLGWQFHDRIRTRNTVIRAARPFPGAFTTIGPRLRVRRSLRCLAVKTTRNIRPA